MIKRNYVNGNIEGECIEYDEKGNIQYIKQYRNNVCISSTNKTKMD